jgi:hypothetical protein
VRLARTRRFHGIETTSLSVCTDGVETTTAPKVNALALSTYSVFKILPSDRNVYIVGTFKLDQTYTP